MSPLIERKDDVCTVQTSKFKFEVPLDIAKRMGLLDATSFHVDLKVERVSDSSEKEKGWKFNGRVVMVENDGILVSNGGLMMLVKDQTKKHFSLDEEVSTYLTISHPMQEDDPTSSPLPRRSLRKKRPFRP